MKKLSLAVWVGLILDLVLLGCIWWITTTLNDYQDALDYSDRQLATVLSYLYMPMAISLILQIISLPILFKIPKLGLTFAVLGSICFLPLSLVFITGYSISYENWINKKLPRFSPQPTDITLKSKSSRFNLLGVIYIILGGIMLVIGASIGSLIVGIAILSFYIAAHLKDRTMIGISQDKLILTPSQFSDTYLVPLKDVSLIKENRAMFKLHIQSEGIDRKCVFRKGMIEQADFQTTLTAIFSQLNKPE